MEKLKTFDEYTHLVNQIRLTHKNIFSNSYWMPEDIQRYIKLDRISYEKVESGIIFFFDEECYYRACLYVDAKRPLTIPSLDKKILIRNVYRAENKEKEMSDIEKYLVDLNFEKVGTTVQLRGDVQEMFEKNKGLERYVQSMERKGYRCVVAEENLYGKIEELMVNTGVIKDYQRDFFSSEEREWGTYLYVVNRNGEMCAANAAIIKNGIAYGKGAAVEDKYKLLGLAPIMSYFRVKWLTENNIKHIQSWVLIDNEASLRYHTSLGYKVTNRHADEWIRESYTPTENA